LKGMGASALVSRAEMDGAAKRAGQAEGCQVYNVKFGNGTIGFDRMDQALPLPIDERAEPALKLAPILDDLARYELRVTGLPLGSYDITIDGEAAAKASSEELGKGVNLANANGPITKQSRAVLKLVFDKNNAFFHRWRDVQLYTFPSWANSPEVDAKRTAELTKIDKQVADLENQIEKARKPKPHHFEVKMAAP